MTTIKSWSKTIQVWFLIAVVGFWIGGFMFSVSNGNREFHRTDGATEQMLLFSTKTYQEQGYLKTWFLPTYPPFGYDSEGNLRDKPFVYTHYFPGPAWMQSIFVGIFGENGITLSRILPLSLNVIGIAWLAIEFSIFMGAGLYACLLATALLTSRAITIFSVSFAGHGYVMAIYLLMFAGLFRFSNFTTGLRSLAFKHWIDKIIERPWIFGFLVGFLQIEFAIDFLSVTFLSAIGLIFFLGLEGSHFSKKFLKGMILGGTFGMVLQVMLFALTLGSLSAAIEDFTKWGSWRMGVYKFKLDIDPQENFGINRVLREYNRQAYGATGFTAWNMVILSAFFIVLGFFGKVKSAIEIKRYCLALIFTYFAAISWNILMRQHSWIHVHFIPRHYIVLFVMMILMVATISKNLVHRSANYSQN